MRDFEYINGVCPVGAGASAIGGKWKIAIIWNLRNGAVRFNELHRMLPKNISQSVLTKQLRELESKEIITRKIYNEIPPKVEYSLTKVGQAFIPIIVEIGEWSEKYLLNK
ncbi:winged helix-turn-helix transcriptional regulator [Candidatus Clostridium radicumherbarum]|uniref:Winged helix-turn-helix transcriptional regulator n=1 Tax=Candidatus Clostridium radicumherbarum TaxID=3381662 RepID=A0ABW8TUG8_9CLOT